MTTEQVFPPVVYAPTVAPVDGAQGDARLAMHRTADGRTAVFVYSALDRLVSYYRADAPWVLLTVADLQRAHDAEPYDLLFLDRRPAPATASTPGDGS